MVVTFPHLGNTYIAVKIMFDYLGVDYVIPPLNSKENLVIGASLSPDEICLPFKYMIGNYVQSIEKGADTILLVGSCGPCRLGEYGELQEKIMRKKYDFIKFIVIDYPQEIGTKEFLNRLSQIVDGKKLSKRQITKALVNAFKAINIIDNIEEKVYELSAYEVNKGELRQLLAKCKKEVIEEKNPDEAVKILEKYKKILKNIELYKEKEPIKIAVVGEIYTNIENCSNMNIEDKLTKLGVSVKKLMRPSWWLKHTALKPVLSSSKMLFETAEEFVSLNIGAYARESIGETLLAYKNNFDGVIQMFPVGCMPEIVVKAMLPVISEKYDFPIMTLVVDEMTGEEGFNTRVEAFVDMLERRKH